MSWGKSTKPFLSLRGVNTMQSMGNLELLTPDEKRAALASLLKTRTEAKSYPLSSGQQRIWFLTQLEPESAAYNLPLVFIITDELRVDVVQQSLNILLQRHRVLRSVFASEDGEPVQRVQALKPVELQVEKVEGVSEADWQGYLQQRSNEQSRKPIDIERGPLFRLEVLSRSDNQHALVMTIHHIVMDGWSVGVLLRELAELSIALATGRPNPLPPLSHQFADFAKWQQKRLKGDAIEIQVEHWKRRLEGASAALELPADFARPPLQTFRGASHFFTVPLDLTDKLRSLGKESGATLFMTMFASFNVLLSRLSGQDDIVLGISVANRERKELWDLLGLFANTVPMRSDLSGDPAFRELLERVRGNALEDYSHPDVPLERLVEELKPVRDMSRNLLFQAGFDYQNSPWPIFAGEVGVYLPNMVTLMNGDNGAAKLDLNLSFSENLEGLLGTFEYSTDLFAADTIGRFVDYYLRLLTSIVEHPGSRLSQLEILSEGERGAVIAGCNQTSFPYPSEASVHTLFERQVRRTPDREAVVEGGRGWSYRELSERSNRLARALRDAGVAAESRVGLCCDRSREMIAGLLAVLKAGGSYVPLDPSLPAARLEFIARDAGVSVLLTDRQEIPAWLDAGVEIVHLGSDAPALARRSGEDLQVLTTPANEVYVIYTSGSTGLPKGVMVTGRSLVNHALASGAEFGLEPGDRVLQFASISFDASAEEIFSCLTHGATLVLRSEAMLSTPAKFLETCGDWGISVLDLPTAYWHELVAALAAAPVEIPSALRLVILGGEAAVPEMVNAWRQQVGARVRLLNTYGPTEATIVATASDLSASQPSPEMRHRVPIGLPIRNVAAYVTDSRLQPVPPMVCGEIMLGGAGIARGYLARRRLTAERFVPDPFGGEPGTRLYRSGDLGRRGPGSELEFIGRADGQGKLPGCRSEPGELEAVLTQHRGADQAVASVHTSPRSDQRLVAFVVPHPQRPATRSELRDWLRRHLPEYMVPAIIHTLDALPQTVSGKVDRRALSALASDSPEPARKFTAPRTPSEEVLAGIWAETLGVDRVGIFDDFFELGGHSLLATRMLSRVRRSMGPDLPLYSLFEAPTIARFAASIEAESWSEQGMTPPPIAVLPRSEEDSQTFAQSFAQQRLWFLEQFEPGTSAYHIPNAVKLTGELDLWALEESLNEIIRRHEVLRTTFRQEGDLPVQLIAPELRLSVPVTDLSGLEPGQREEQIKARSDSAVHRPFDLSRGPLLRMEVLRLAPDEHVLLFTIHHIVSDAWSMGVLVQELAVLYPAFRMREPSPLPALDLQYADVAQWQHEWLSGELLDRQLEYWRGQLEGAPAFLRLPADRAAGPPRSLAGGSVALALDEGLSESVRRFSRSQTVTPFMTLLAAFNALLSRYSGQLDIVVGTPIANRRREELEPLIGFFINTLVMRSDLSGNPSFRQLVERARETALEAYAHQDLPFERLVEQLAPVRGWSGTPLFRVMFILQNAPMAPLELPGLELEPMALDNRATKFDLTLEVIEHPTSFVTIAQYNTDLFEESTIERMLAHYRCLLEGAVTSPDTCLQELLLLTSAERELIDDWSDTPLPAEQAALLRSPFELEPESIESPAAPGRVFVLDAHRELVPVGVPGELYVGGEALAMGFTDLPGQTAERFVPDTWSGREGRRAYRTGHRARWSRGGALELLGRVEDQLEVQGYRIESWEIEEVFHEHPGVRRAVVVARRDSSGEPSLVAYVERRQADSPTESQLRETLNRRLPEFMVPSTLMFLASLPRTIDGELDRGALPAPASRTPAPSDAGDAAAGAPLEKALARIWAAVLGCERVGLNESFFELGGHSLLATQVVSQMREVLGLEVPLASLFEGPTVAELARSIERRWQGAGVQPALVQALPLSFAQQRWWFLEQLEPDTSIYNMPHAARLRGELDLQTLERAVDELVQRHESLRTTFALREDRPVQLIAAERPSEVAVIALRKMPESEQDERTRSLLEAESRRPFDLTRGPLLRVLVLHRAVDEHLLLIVVHRIIADDRSVEMLVRELSTLYSAFGEGRESPLPPLPLEASDVFCRQAALPPEAFEAKLSFWRERLQAAPAVLELAADRPRTAAQSGRGACVSSTFGTALTDSLERLGRRQGATLFMVLAAGFKALLHRQTGQRDIVVGTPVAEYEADELRSMVADLTNMVPLRTDLTGAPSFRELLTRVRETASSAWANRDLPFEKLVEEVGAQRRWSRTPIFQVTFELSQADAPLLELPPLVSTPVTVGKNTTMFDLALEAVEHPDGLKVTLRYSTDLFDEGTIRRMLDHYRRLLDGAAKDSDAPIAALPLLSTAEYDQLVHGWNDTACPVASTRIHEAIEQVAVEQPKAVAIVQGEESLSYAELNRRAERVARRLRRLGVGVEDRVALCLERSMDFVIGALGTLKCGAAYVPLDPSNPLERRSFMLADAQAKALLVPVPLAEDLAGEVPTLCVRALYCQPDGALAGDTASGLPAEPAEPLHLARIFETSAAVGPAAEALVWRDERWTYGELDRRANQLARRLRRFGVGPEARVAIHLRRRPEALIALLATLKAGGAYVSLDPAYPSERTALILADAEPVLVLVDAGAEPPAVAAGGSAPASMAAVMSIEDALRDAAREDDGVLPETSHPDSFAYLLYTSGSTGRPKGVAIPHRAAANLVRWAGESLPAEELAGMLASTSFNFDLSVFELFAPWSVGGKVILAVHALDLRGLPAAEEVTFVNTVPSAMAELVREDRLPAGVRAVGLAGEELHRPLADRVYALPGVARLYNLYGPSDTTTYSTWEEAAPSPEKPAIGRPTADTSVFLLDEDMRQVEPGEVGELYIAGAGLALGYLGRPRRTACAFIPHPFADAPHFTEGARLYRTGDLARELPDGRLDFLGRKDHQVKVRGFRIELGEIETALDRCPAVRAAAVLAVDSTTPGDKQLVAWVVREGNAPASELRDFVARLLPSYMVPATFAFVDELPLTPSGKIDRKALGQRQLPAADEAPGRAPAGATEQAVAAIWAEVLGRPRVGADESFLDLGGHSLIASRVVARIRATLGVELPLPAPFEHPTVAALAAAVDAAHQTAATSSAEREPVDQPESPQCLRSCGLWFIEQDRPGECTYNVPLLLELRGPLSVPALAAAFAEVVRRHEILHSAFTAIDNVPVQCRGGAAAAALPLIDLSGLAPEARQRESDRLREGAARRRFDLAAGSVIRYQLQKLADEEHALVLVLHHIVTDEWSNNVLVDELAALYRGTPLPPAAVQYAEYARWYERQPETEAWREALRYWRRRLAGAPPLLELPADRPRPAVRSSRGGVVRAIAPMPPELETLRRQGFSEFMVLFAAFNAWLHRVTGADDLVVGTPAAYRPWPELEEAMGCFVSMLPLRVRASGNPSFTELVERVKQTCLGAFKHTEVPFDLIVEELRPQRSASYSPIVQVAFVWQNMVLPAELAPGLDLEVHELDTGTAKFDLALSLRAGDRGLEMVLEHSRDLFDDATAERMLRQFQQLLSGALAAPDKRLSRLPLRAARDQASLPDRARPEVAKACDDESRSLSAAPLNPAYVIYTSGSTGMPKGVEISHGSLTNLVEWHRRTFEVTSEDRATLLAGVGFDASVLELWPNLACGASIYVVDDATRRDPPALVEYLRQNAITLSFMPTPLAEEALKEEALEATCLRHLLVGGDRLHTYAQTGHEYQLVNLYGPTEATVLTTSSVVPAEVAASAPAIGRPIANHRAYVLDPQLEVVPVGVAGELYLGGLGLARGYFDRPGLTAERFVPDALSGNRDARLYRTGDRVRMRPDGELDFLGRLDEQVKVRGHRIEPGEIEAALYEQPGVRRAVVVVRDDLPGGPRLVAYLEQEGAAPSSAELRQVLGMRLPEFMVPSAFVVLEALPETANGKVDRKALPMPEDGGPSTVDYVAPQTPLEETLSLIWAEVLSLERVGVKDNFFELGGHSLLATQVLSRVSNELGLGLPVSSLFEEPTVHGLARGIEGQRWQTEGTPTPLLAPVAQTSGRKQVFPQSFAQQRIWFLEQLEPGTSTYNIPSAVRLQGELDVAALEQSFNELIRRHESLRTSFTQQGGEAVQVIAQEASLSMALIDLESLPVDERQAVALGITEREARRPFDLASGLLFRAIVLRFEERENILLFVIHHIIVDGWSMGVLVREVSVLFEAFRAGRRSPLPPLALNASDFFGQQEEWMQQSAFETQLSYWRERLEGAPAVLELPTDRPRTAAQSGRGATEVAIIPPSLSEPLKDLSQRQGASLFMVLLAAFKAMLHRYNGVTDIVVGTPIANRQWQEVESLVGHVTNAVALRTDLVGDPSFRDLLARVRETALGAYAHQNLPFEKLVDVLGPGRHLGRTPIFQAMFVLQNTPMPPLELPGLVPEALTIGEQTSMCDLTLEIVEHSYGLVAAFQYSTDLFDAETIQRMLGHYQRLLEGVLEDPGARISELPLLTAAELGHLVGGQCDTPARPEPAEALHVLFERQAARTPERVALVDEREELTYAQLEARANRLAHHLIARGLGPEARVGVCLGRSASMVVGVLGVLKAGAGYLPLDPAYPPSRLAFMLEDGGVEVLLTEQGLVEELPEPRGGTICIDRDWPEIARRPACSPGREVTWDQLAYMIYTSGSTGRPKGVMIEHRSAVALLRWAHTFFAAEELEAVLASTSLCFDLSVFELFAPLTCGGRAVVVANLLELTEQHGVTLINTVPSLMEELLRSSPLLPEVRTINLAGEALASGLVRSLRLTAPGTRVVNLYGPSEDTTYSTVYEVPAERDQEPLIGAPVAYTQAYVLDAALRLVPLGITREIYLGGAGVTRGYLARPALTAERFVPDPFGGEPGMRLYKTGDLGRMLADGNLAYQGRADNQVKLRGCRIELGEIEAVLDLHEEVAKAVAIVRQDTPGEPRLVAYVVPRDGNAVSATALRKRIREHLPEYMTPSDFVSLGELPLNPNGKIDRGALPALESMPEKSARPFVEPRTSAERVLAEIWSELLAAEAVGVQDNFFELGGHSLLATQMLSRVKKVLMLEVPLRRFFDMPTVDGVCDVLADVAGGHEVVEEIAQVYLEIAQMSGDEVQQLLSEEPPMESVADDFEAITVPV